MIADDSLNDRLPRHRQIKISPSRPQAETLVNDCPVRLHRTVFSTRPRTEELLALVPSLPGDREEDRPSRVVRVWLIAKDR